MNERWDTSCHLDAAGLVRAMEDNFGHYIPHTSLSERSSLLGRRFAEIISCPKTDLIFQTILERVQVDQQPLELPYRRDDADQRRHLEMRIEPVKGDQGGLTVRTRSVRTEPRPPVSLLDPARPRSAEVVAMCCWCNRIQTPRGWLEAEQAMTPSA